VESKLHHNSQTQLLEKFGRPDFICTAILKIEGRVRKYITNGYKK
jgi:hypothetical protein